MFRESNDEEANNQQAGGEAARGEEITMSLAERIIKKGKLDEEAAGRMSNDGAAVGLTVSNVKYKSTKHVLPTSNIVERLFSQVKLCYDDHYCRSIAPIN